MVQLFYYENYGKCCRKILNHEGSPNKIMLFPDEGWARNAPSAYWIVKRPWWSRSICKITEVSGTRRHATWGKITDLGKGTMYIKGKFKKSEEPDCKMYLTSHVSSSDFRMGYSMTGILERGNKKNGKLQFTHFAMIRRRDHENVK